MNTLYSLVAAAMFKQAGLSDKELEHRSPLHFWPWLAKGVAGATAGALFRNLPREAKIPVALGIGGSIAALHHFNKKRVARELAEKRAKKAEQ